MEALIQVRRGTAAQWIASNPVMSDGEPGLETDTGKGKYGKTGVHWIDLPYSWAYGPTGPAGGALSGTFPNPGLAGNSVGATQITDGSVGTNELAGSAVTTAKIASGAVGPTQLADSSVSAAKISSNAVDSSKIVDKSIAIADLADATVASLMVDVADEGAVVVPEATRINFVGSGVSAAGSGGVATVTITGGGTGTDLAAGTIAQFAASSATPTPPAGWYMCDGSVKSDMAGTLGTMYGATAGTLPNIIAVPPDQLLDSSDIVNTVSSGWSVTTVYGRLFHGMVHMYFSVQRTGADLTFANPNFADVPVFTIKSDFRPQVEWAGNAAMNCLRSIAVSDTGQVFVTAGISGNSFDNGNIRTNDVIQFNLFYPIQQTNFQPRIFWIIKAP